MIDPGQSACPAQNWKLTLAYDGTGFRGWQVQPGERTVQGELQAALGRVTGETPLPQGSGRTDAGVHALAQVASFALHVPIPAGNLLMALNRTLPPSIRVLQTREVQSTFHARHSAIAKTYEYHVFQEKLWPWNDKRAPGRICPPFLAPYIYAYPWPLQLEALQEAARALLGEHDFLSFAATDPDLTMRCQKASTAPETRPLPRPDFQIHPPTLATVRTLFASAWEIQENEAGPHYLYRVRGSGFLHHMVRNLVGTMLDVGRGQLRAAQIPGIIAARSRSAAGPTAPAQGLFLHSVEYGGAEEG
jgi:tRNA pseudouridine38-40 synthase